MRRQAGAQRPERRNMTAPLGPAPLIGGGGAAAPSSPLATFPLVDVTSRSWFFFLSGDLGITIGTGVSAWADQTGNERHATQVSGTAQPAYSASDADFGDRGSVAGDGVNDTMSVAWDPPAPGTTNIWFFAVILQRTYTAGEYIWAGGNIILALAQSPATPQLRQFNTTGANANAGAVVGTASEIEEFFNNTTTSYLRCGSTFVTGANPGNSDATAFALFSRPGSGFGDVKIACVGACDGEPTAGELDAIRASAAAYYPGLAV